VPRPRKIRNINSWPGAVYFKPRGIPLAHLEVISLTLEEYEAMRLYDSEGMDQTEAAAKMGISRATFGRIINSAHKKVADALRYGRAIGIEGGDYRFTPAPGRGGGQRMRRGRGRGRGGGGRRRK